MKRALAVAALAAAAGFSQTRPPAPPPRAPAARPASAASQPVQPPAAVSVDSLKAPPLNPIRLPEPAAFTLANGMKLYLLEDRSLPVVSGLARIGVGSLLDPEGKAGLAALAGTVMRTGGTTSQTGDQWDRRLQDMASTLEARTDQTSTTVSFTALKENAAPTLAIFKDLLTAPDFAEDQLEQAKAEMRIAIAHRNDDARRIAAREFADLIYGNLTPYGRRQTYSSVDRITRADLLEFHARYFFPKNVLLAVWGDFEAAAMKTALESLFADWKADQPPPAFPKPGGPAAGGAYQAVQREAGRTYFAMGGMGGQWNDPDAAALEVLARLVPAGVRSRVVQNAGAAADLEIAAEWAAQYDHPGLFEILGSAKSASAGDAVQAIRDELARLRSALVSEAELRPARVSAMASLAFSAATSSAAMRQLLDLDSFGYPKDFLELRRKALAEVTPADVLRAGRERLDPSSFTLVAAGVPAFLTPPGAAPAERPREVDLRIPALAPAPASPEGLAKGAALLERARAAVGGDAALTSIRDYTQAATIRTEDSGQAIKTASQWLAPAAWREEREMEGGKRVLFLNGRAGWSATKEESLPLAGARLQQALGDLFRLYFRLLLSDRLEDRTANAISSDTVEISDRAGELAQLSIDPETGAPLRVRYSAGQAGGAPASTEESWSDFREVAGVRIPHKIVVTSNGRKIADVSLTECRINSGLKLEDLEKHP